MRNATYLFEKPCRDVMKNSESRWTAVAQMSLIYMSNPIRECELPVYKSDEMGYLEQVNIMRVSNFHFSNTVCEQGLTGPMFGITDFDLKYYRIAPDITNLRVAERHVTLIEVKTLSESVVRNIELYDECCQYLRASFLVMRLLLSTFSWSRKAERLASLVQEGVENTHMGRFVPGHGENANGRPDRRIIESVLRTSRSSSAPGCYAVILPRLRKGDRETPCRR